MKSRFSCIVVMSLLSVSPVLGASGETKEACLQALVREQLAGTAYADFTLSRFQDPWSLFRTTHAANTTYEGRGNGILVTGRVNVRFTHFPGRVSLHLDRSSTIHEAYYSCTIIASGVVNDEDAFVATADGRVQRRVAGTFSMTRAEIRETQARAFSERPR